MPSSEEQLRLVEHLRWQSRACESLGSTFYAILLEHLADDAKVGGVTARLLSGQGDDVADLQDRALALRLLGGVHRLVLSDQAPGLAAHFPSVGGDGDADAAVAPLLAVLADHEHAVRDALQRAPQTNEVGRAAALVGGLCHLVDARPLPIRLLEIGASAGLNLRCDHFELRTEDGGSFGPADSPARLENAWRGRLPPKTHRLELVERSGCDLHPLDPTTDDGALTLTSYVWPDQSARLARLRGALAVAADVPAEVMSTGAADFLNRAELRPGSWLVVWHSVMWQYVDAVEQEAVVARLNELGARATAEAPLAHVALEPQRIETGLEFLVTVQTWPDVGLGVGEQVLGRAAPHGLPVDWTERDPTLQP